MSEYQEFLQAKVIQDLPSGIDVDPSAINREMREDQRAIVRWALRRGRAAIFADCGLGKTFDQIEWARHVPGRVLILAPLAVAPQTVREGERFGIPVEYSRTGRSSSKITITNYEMLDHFDLSDFEGIVLDESSILKSFEGKMRTRIIETSAKVRFRLACTATPAPNDYMELGNHSEFLGVMSRTEMLSMFFVHDGGETQKWRLKGHAETPFWQWICSWAINLRKPSDLGFSDEGFSLPPIRFHHIVVGSPIVDGYLFPVEANTLQERQAARKVSTEARAEKCAEIVNATDDAWVIWCNLNAESEALAKAIPDAVEVRGSDTVEHKESTILGFANGSIRRIVTKPSIAGFGVNWQACHKMAFVGLSDSYEQFYQATRRCWRFGQTHPVGVYIITADQEGAVVENIERKEREARRMSDEMVDHMKDINVEALRTEGGRTRDSFNTFVEKTDRWEMRLGDCVDEVTAMPDNSIDYSVFSPPFASLYTYSASERDMGNCPDDETFMVHFGFLVKQLFRVIKPGRLLSFHCMNMPTSKAHHGYIGIRDFRGELIRLFESHGWIFHSEVCIWKDPVTAMQRTKALGLLHKQLCKDSCMSRQGIPDYLVTMRKPGDNPEPVSGGLAEFVGDPSTFSNTGNLSIDIWQRYASPVWMDIRATRTLQAAAGRAEKDERHICPLQLDVIERGIQLWSNPGDTILSPFAGIGSEGYCAIEMGRKFIGVELKRSYFDAACKNIRAAESTTQHDLFSDFPVEDIQEAPTPSAKELEA